MWEPPLCQGLSHPSPRLCLTCFRIQRPSGAAICGKLPPRKTSTEVAQTCPATSILACFRASHLDHIVSKTTPVPPYISSLSMSLGYLPSLGAPSPSQHQVLPPLSKLTSVVTHHWVPIFFLPLHTKNTQYSHGQVIRGRSEMLCLSREAWPESRMLDMERHLR